MASQISFLYKIATVEIFYNVFVKLIKEKGIQFRDEAIGLKHTREVCLRLSSIVVAIVRANH